MITHKKINLKKASNFNKNKYSVVQF